MRIYCEDTMPYGAEFFRAWGEVSTFTGPSLQPKQLHDAEVLLVRSTTQVDQALLEACPNLTFVATATAGTDHMDLQALNERGIAYNSAAGANANAVAEYILSVLLVQADAYGWHLAEKSVGIIGAGHVGSAVADKLSALGMQVLLYDPPLADQGDPRSFVALEKIMTCDIISLHVPLTSDGAYPTQHLFDAQRLAALADDQLLINAARGAVLDNSALLALFESGRTLNVVLDVFEQEPNINFALLPYLALATPHIAGHSLEGKARGTEFVYRQVAEVLNLPAPLRLADFLPSPPIQHIDIGAVQVCQQSLLKRLVCAMYDVRDDHRRFCQSVQDGPSFNYFRKHYAIRREFDALTISAGKMLAPEVLYQLGFRRPSSM